MKKICGKKLKKFRKLKLLFFFQSIFVLSIMIIIVIFIVIKKGIYTFVDFVLISNYLLYITII